MTPIEAQDRLLALADARHALCDEFSDPLTVDCESCGKSVTVPLWEYVEIDKVLCMRCLLNS